MLHEKPWLATLAWLGILLLPVLIGSLWLPDVAERWRARRWHPLRRLAIVGELLVRLAYALAVRVLRPGRKARAVESKPFGGN